MVPDLKSSLDPQSSLGGDKTYPEKSPMTFKSNARRLHQRPSGEQRQGLGPPGVRESFLEEGTLCWVVRQARNQAAEAGGRASQAERRPRGLQC